MLCFWQCAHSATEQGALADPPQASVYLMQALARGHHWGRVVHNLHGCVTPGAVGYLTLKARYVLSLEYEYDGGRAQGRSKWQLSPTSQSTLPQAVYGDSFIIVTH